MADSSATTGSREANTYAYSSRVRNPFRVALAIWRVVRDIRNTSEAAIVEIAFARSRVMRRFAGWEGVIARMIEAHPELASAFRDRPRLGWIDVAALAQLREGTLGRVYAEHLQSNGLDPNLVDIPDEDDPSYFLQHLFESHDIWHVVTGCGTDEAGELAVGGFYVAQTDAPFFAFLLGLIFLNTAFSKPGQLQDRLRGLSRGYLAGREARPLFGVDWSSRWSVPIEDVRTSLDLPAQPTYSGEGIHEGTANTESEASDPAVARIAIG
jgi:ubiquinone biosynthesis protein Coq4